MLETGRLTQQSAPMLEDSGGSGEDVIEEIVHEVLKQCMMMAMTEVQYGFIYEFLKNAIIEKYAVELPDEESTEDSSGYD